MKKNFRFVSILLSILTVFFAFPSSGEPIFAYKYNINRNPQSYILEKFKSHDLVLLGTRHKKQPILHLISELIPNLYDAGVTYIGLEICSDQQDDIRNYLQTGTGLSDVEIHPQIDCPEYRNLFTNIRNLRINNRPNVIALDLPRHMYGGRKSRDEYMARSIAKIYRQEPDAKILVILGNNHVLKKLDWQNHVLNNHRAIRSYLDELVPVIKAFSIGQCIDENPSECDFTRKFSVIEGAVALDINHHFDGWKIGIISVVAIKHAQPSELFDSVIIY